MKTATAMITTLSPEISRRMTCESILRNANDVNGVKRAYIPLTLLT